MTPELIASDVAQELPLRDIVLDDSRRYQLILEGINKALRVERAQPKAQLDRCIGLVENYLVFSSFPVTGKDVLDYLQRVRADQQ